MRLVEIQRRARKLDINDTWKYSKKDLIREVQRREGNFDCFGTAVNNCSQFACCWREDCIR